MVKVYHKGGTNREETAVGEQMRSGILEWAAESDAVYGGAVIQVIADRPVYAFCIKDIADGDDAHGAGCFDGDYFCPQMFQAFHGFIYT